MIVVFGSFLSLDGCFFRCWDSRNPRGARWAGGFACLLWDLETIQWNACFILLIAVAKVFFVRVVFFRFFFFSLFFVRAFLVFFRAVRSCFGGRSLPSARPSGHPLPVCFPFGPFWPFFWCFFFFPPCFVSCMLHFSLG